MDVKNNKINLYPSTPPPQKSTKKHTHTHTKIEWKSLECPTLQEILY